jgi:hypothetical protein
MHSYYDASLRLHRKRTPYLHIIYSFYKSKPWPDKELTFSRQVHSCARGAQSQRPPHWDNSSSNQIGSRSAAKLLPLPSTLSNSAIGLERSCERAKIKGHTQGSIQVVHASNTFVGKHQAKFGGSVSYLSLCFLSHSLISPVSPHSPDQYPL